MSLMDENTKAALLAALEKEYYAETCALTFHDAFELLIATILSAQTTDAQVNKVTPALFARCPDPAALAALDVAELESMIKSIGFYHTKAQHVHEACVMLVERFGGRVPQTLEELTTLPGVGRKTANVVLANAMGQAAIAVDTHVFRVSNRMGLAQTKDVYECEMQLQRAIPRDKWSAAHHWLIWHGRRVCDARKPACGVCPVAEYCERHL